MVVIRERLTWEEMIDRVNTTIKKLQRKPKSMKGGHYLEPGSILDAYCEGDLTFKQAVKELEIWKRN